MRCDEIARLTRLRQLDLDFCELTELPEAVMELRALTSLWADHNRLTTLPAEFGHLPKLAILFLMGNPLQGFPEPVLDLPHLRMLMLADGAIQTRTGGDSPTPAPEYALDQQHRAQSSAQDPRGASAPTP